MDRKVHLTPLRQRQRRFSSAASRSINETPGRCAEAMDALSEKKQKKHIKHLTPPPSLLDSQWIRKGGANCRAGVGANLVPQRVSRCRQPAGRRLPQSQQVGAHPEPCQHQRRPMLSRRAPLLSVTPTLGPLPSKHPTLQANLLLNPRAPAGVDHTSAGAPLLPLPSPGPASEARVDNVRPAGAGLFPLP